MTLPSNRGTHDLELIRLGRLLGVDPERLRPLEDAPLEDVRAFRDQVTARLFDEGAASFDRVAAVSRIVPAGIAAKLAETALGPVLAARATSAVDPDKAVDLSGRFSTSFLADVAEQIDPRTVDDLTPQMPPHVIASVSSELASRGEWLVMADFLATISHAALDATLKAMTEEQILRVALLLEDAGRMDEIVALLDDGRLERLVAVGREEDLGEALAITEANVTGQQAERVAAALDGGPA